MKPLSILIFSGYFAIDPEQIKGGIGYRYVGLYGSLIKNLLKRSPKSEVFWYSVNDELLRTVRAGTDNQCVRLSMIRATMNSINFVIKKNGYVTVLIAYPYAIPKRNKVPGYLLSLLVLKISSLTGRVKLVVDDFDPPVESSYAFSDNVQSTLITTYGRAMELIALKLANMVLVVSSSYKRFLAKCYRIKEEKFLVVTNGCLIKYVNLSKTAKNDSALRVLYAGSAMKEKDTGKLVQAIDALRKRGLRIELYVAGSKQMDLPEWVRTSHSTWIAFTKNLLINSDIGVIPYPSSKPHFYYALPAKLFDYMAAGKPIISTNLKDVSYIIKTYNCGLIAKDWVEFMECITSLYYNRDLAKTLGNNGRKAVENIFDYELIANNLLEKLLDEFR